MWHRFLQLSRGADRTRSRVVAMNSRGPRMPPCTRRSRCTCSIASPYSSRTDSRVEAQEKSIDVHQACFGAGANAAPSALHERGEAIELGRGGCRACGREPVVAAALVVERGIGALLGLLDQAVGEQPLDRAVERAGAELDRAVAEGVDVADERVAVALAPPEGEEDVQRGGLEGSRALRLSRHPIYQDTTESICQAATPP